MNLEKQVCSLELAKKLKELGMKQESYFCYVNTKQGGEPHFLTRNVSFMREKNYYSAFTVAELGEIMKGKGMGTSAYSEMWKKWWVSGGKWIVEKQKYETTIEADTEADARAKMLIYLLENKLISEHIKEE